MDHTYQVRSSWLAITSKTRDVLMRCSRSSSNLTAIVLISVISRPFHAPSSCPIKHHRLNFLKMWVPGIFHKTFPIAYLLFFQRNFSMETSSSSPSSSTATAVSCKSSGSVGPSASGCSSSVATSDDDSQSVGANLAHFNHFYLCSKTSCSSCSCSSGSCDNALPIDLMDFLTEPLIEPSLESLWFCLAVASVTMPTHFHTFHNKMVCSNTTNTNTMVRWWYAGPFHLFHLGQAKMSSSINILKKYFLPSREARRVFLSARCGSSSSSLKFFFASPVDIPLKPSTRRENRCHQETASLGNCA